MKQFQFNASEEDIKIIISNIDTDGNGTIELHEFLNFISTYHYTYPAKPVTRKIRVQISRRCSKCLTKTGMD